MTDKDVAEWLMELTKKYIPGGDEQFDSCKKEVLDRVKEQTKGEIKMDYRNMCCEVDPTDEVRPVPIKDQLIEATKKLIDMRSLLFNIVEGISSGQRADEKVPEASCINDSARNINMLIDQCMELANGVHNFMF